MIRVPRVTRSRSFGVLKTFAMAAGILALACAKDALVTGPKTSPDARLGVRAAPAFSGPSVVISQVYGGGGNTGTPAATLKYDFIEIHNRGTEPLSLAGWSVQYASSTGAFNQLTPLSGTLAAGRYLLIQEAAGTAGTVDLPTPHIDGTIAMAAGAGKVALVQGTAGVVPTALGCIGTGTSLCPTTIVDLVGYGAANYSEGAPTAVLNNQNAAIRKDAGCTDTDNNALDFTVAAAAPRTTASLPVTCGESAPRVATTIPAASGFLGDPPSITISFSEPVDVTDDWFRISCSVSGLHTAQSTSGPQSYVLSELGEFEPGEACTATVFSAFVHDQDVVDPPDVMDADYSWSFSTPSETGPLPEVRFTEIHYDNFEVDAGEAIEIEGPVGRDLTGWDIVLYNGNGGVAYNTVHLSGSIPATCDTRGVVVTTYPSNGIQNGSPDGFALVHGSTVVEFLSYEGSFAATDGPAAGLTSTDIGVAEDGSPNGQSLQRQPGGAWNGSAASTFGECNATEGGGSGGGKSITFSGRTPANPPLPVGFEDQLFGTLHNGAIIEKTTFTWSSATPDIASIDANGVMRARAAGSATFVATAADGTTGSWTLPTTVATLGGRADYAGNTEFGIPTDGDPGDDFIITRDQYTISYNHNRNTPNWVSYEFDATHFAADGNNVDRCDCFTHDPALPASFTHLTTADYTGAGDSAGYGIDRGHMARSHDFTSGTLDNALSYYLSNIIPQAAKVNQGPWAILENYIGDRAENVSDNKEVYVIDGVAGNKGTVKNEGKIVMPAFVWKVALVLPRDKGLADVHHYQDITEVVAVIMPNEPVIDPDWKTYKTTVDEIERVSGYDLLSLLPDKIERAVESNSRPPIAVANGPYTSTEGSALSLSASDSFDGGGTIVGYSWTFGDGASAAGETASHTYAQDGTYMVRLIVTDNLGVADTSFTSANVANVVPAVASLAGATLLPGETYSATGSFTDPGADPWSATVNYGDNASVEILLLSGKTFTLSHTYLAPGRFTVTVRVSDDDATATRTQSVTVLAPSQGLSEAVGLVQDLANAAGLNSGNANSLNAKIDAALKQLANGNSVPAANQLRALLREIDAMILSGRVNARDAEPLQAIVNRVIRSISP